MPRKKKIEDSVILKMILEVIIKVGATEFSLEDLSKKTRLSPATLLQRFGSKKKILHQAIELANSDLQQKLTYRTVTNKSLVQEIINIYLEFAAPIATPADVAGGLDILKLDITQKKLNALTREYFAIRRKKIESLLVSAQKCKELPQYIAVSETVWNLESLWQGSIMLWALVGNGSLQYWLKKSINNYFKMMAKP